MENFEAELKFILKSPEKAIANLSTIATLAKKDEYQKDTYYIPAHRNFLDKNPVAEWLRVRETKDSTSINYKNRGTNNTCDEFETKVAKIDQLTHILARLDFKPIIVVEKSRTTWQYKKAEIAIDEVTDLGSYIEIEAKGDFNSKEEAIAYVYEIAKELEADLGDQDSRGYPYRLLERDGYKF